MNKKRQTDRKKERNVNCWRQLVNVWNAATPKTNSKNFKDVSDEDVSIHFKFDKNNLM